MIQMSVLKVAVLGATIMALAACSQQTPGPYTKFEGMPPDATVTMDEVQAAYIGNAGGGSGTLRSPLILSSLVQCVSLGGLKRKDRRGDAVQDAA
jgi:hypothetical protein